MKTILTATLLLTTVFMVAPSATACEVSDPTGTTYTCVDSYEFSYGDCGAGNGHGTSAYSYAPDVGRVAAGFHEACFYEYQYEGAFVYVEPTGTIVSAGHSNYGSCYYYAHAYAASNWHRQQIAC